MNLGFIVVRKAYYGASTVFSSLLDGFADAAAGGNHHKVSDFEMANDTDLAPHHDVAACFGCPSNAGLSADDVVLANLYVMGDLDEVIDFGPFADSCSLEPGSIDCAIGSHFHIIFDDDVAELLELGVFSCFVGGEAKPT